MKAFMAQETCKTPRIFDEIYFKMNHVLVVNCTPSPISYKMYKPLP